jgi:hypothetical protein
MATGIRSTTHTLAEFAAGALLVNAVPHTVKGLSGERFPTPFANPPGVGLSSPTENVAWGAVDLVVPAESPRRRSLRSAEVTPASGRSPHAYG